MSGNCSFQFSGRATRIALRFGRLRQRGALRLLDIEHVSSTEADDGSGIVFLRLITSPRHYRRQDRDAFSPLRTNRPSVRHVWKPATRVAVGRCATMRQTL